MTKRRQLHVKRMRELDARLAAVSCTLALEQRRMRALIRWMWLANLALRRQVRP